MNWFKRFQKAKLQRAARNQAKRAVTQMFADLHPHEKGFTHLKADERDRFIFWVWFGKTRPPKYQFFEVDKNNLTARLLDDDSNYRPEIWR